MLFSAPSPIFPPSLDSLVVPPFLLLFFPFLSLVFYSFFFSSSFLSFPHFILLFLVFFLHLCVIVFSCFSTLIFFFSFLSLFILFCSLSFLLTPFVSFHRSSPSLLTFFPFHVALFNFLSVPFPLSSIPLTLLPFLSPAIPLSSPFNA